MCFDIKFNKSKHSSMLMRLLLCFLILFCFFRNLRHFCQERAIQLFFWIKDYNFWSKFRKSEHSGGHLLCFWGGTELSKIPVTQSLS